MAASVRNDQSGVFGEEVLCSLPRFLITPCSSLSPQGCTMPIVDKLKEALKPGRKDSADDGDLGRLLAASARKVLLQKIEFEPASKSFSCQLESLKSKYVLLNPNAEGPSQQRSGDEAQARRQGTGPRRAGRQGLRDAGTDEWEPGRSVVRKLALLCGSVGLVVKW